MFDKLDDLLIRFEEVLNELGEPDVTSNPDRFQKLMKEQSDLQPIVDTYKEYKKNKETIQDSLSMLEEEKDEDMREMLKEELSDAKKRVEELEQELKILLLPKDPNDSKNVIVEIRAGAGGDEAALFAGELFRAYLKFAEKQHWHVEVLDQSDTDLGGIKNVSFSLSGEDVYSLMKYESGVHRVQRVPATEAGGRIHTSTVTVAVMPEAEEVELDIRPEDLRFDVFRSSGPGGQCVNTTDSAVRVTHIPTGLSVASQQEKSQHRNKEIALRILYARMLELKQREEADKQAADKRSQVGTGDRSERIRTYNFPQNRVTDHRFNISTFDLPKLMEGEFGLILDQILMIACERRLDQLRTEQ